MNARKRILEDLPREHGFEPLHVEGALPPGLRGTLYRNGPALTGRFGRRYTHIFEGDGAVSAVRLGDGAAQGAVRLVRTAGFNEETEAGRLLYGFGAPWPTRMRRAWADREKNTANTSVLWWNDGLYALMEACRPVAVDPDTLDTRGERDLDGVIERSFSAHPHRVASLDTVFNIGLRYGREPGVVLYAWPRGGACRRLGFVPLPRNTMLHDFIVTARHLVLFVNPVTVNLWRAIAGIGPFEKLLQWRPELGTEVIVVPLDDPERPARFTVEPFFQWHFANAFEDGDAVVVDYCRYPDFDSIGAIDALDASDIAMPVYHRARVRPASQGFESTPLGLSCDFPRIDPAQEGQRHDAAVVLGHAEGRDTLARLAPDDGAVDQLALGADAVASEPIFVPEPGGAGWVLCLEYDGARHQSALAVYAADRLPEGALARCWFDHHVPLTFHGAWVEA
ncbi:MAG: carotenoid oxygenase family protein [Alphaproteobacteria bacterium]|nr:carotenoid oxygenase family protein [Alphaproteobacteria bacterium]